MKESHLVHIKDGDKKSYIFRVLLERDGDGWFIYAPALDKWGGATWGATKEQALERIYEVVELILQELAEEGELVPEDVEVSQKPLVAVTL